MAGECGQCHAVSVRSKLNSDFVWAEAAIFLHNVGDTVNCFLLRPAEASE